MHMGVCAYRVMCMHIGVYAYRCVCILVCVDIGVYV